MLKTQTRLPIVEEPAVDATTIKVCGGGTASRGTDAEEDLLCGGCAMVLFERMSVRTLTRTIVAPGQFIVITCGKCGVHNLAGPAEENPAGGISGKACDLCNGNRWICDQHPDQTWPHCEAIGIPCACNPHGVVSREFESVAESEKYRVLRGDSHDLPH
jgi:hypothetical protein